MPKLTNDRWVRHAGGVNALFGDANGPHSELALGEQAGLTLMGVRLWELPPGSRSSRRHWHECEDEFVFVVSGELVLIEEVETPLRAGEAAAWRAGLAAGHCLENRSSAPAVMLVAGTRSAQDAVHYPDHGVVRHRDGKRYWHTDSTGKPIERRDS